jgi:hypothetical protein
MTTSGTVGATTINVATLIEHAFRRAGLSPAQQTVDALNAARENLYFYLSALSNDGVNLWTIEKKVIGMTANQTYFELGVGTLDVRNVLFRNITLASGGTAASSAGGTAANAFDGSLSAACTQASANGNISYNFGTQVTIANIGFQPNGQQTYTLVWEYSDDGSTWTEFYSNAKTTYDANTWYYWDINAAPTAQYFRVRETGNGILNVLQVCFNQIVNEIPLGRINIDQYTNLVNKTFDSTFTNQYWFDRQASNPRIWVWPIPSYDFSQFVVWKTRQIQDVGSLTNTLELPDRWIDAVVTALASRLLMEIPGADWQRYEILKREADAATYRAQQEERDDSPIMISPVISCYTR